MKATVKKSTTVKKPIVKAKVAPAKKAASKPVQKPTAKPSKAAAKPAPKAAAKSVSKLASKPAAKPVAKKASPKPAKSLAKPVPKVPAPAAKTAKPSTPVKAKTSTPTKAPISVSAKTPAKAPAKASAKPSAVPPAKVGAAPSTGKPTAKQTTPAPSKPAAPTVAPVIVSPKPRTSKSGFISPANIAPKLMEVSTAAKTNFTMSSPVLAPPPQLAVKKDAKLVNNWKTKTAALLTDAEAIAMPDSEYMSALQMAFFRLKLVQLKKDILSNAGETTEHLREDTSVVPDPADRATIEEEHALELRTRDRERKLLKKIEQSIARIDSEDYGYCDETGEPIGIARLIARPTANLSLEAQQRRELKQKMFGD